MASVATPANAQEQVMDTRTPSPLPKAAGSHGSASDGAYQPDLSQEVAMLSTKLINAINFQTTLDDQLQQTKHELEISQRQFEKLQAEKKYLDDMIQERILVRKQDVDPVIESLRTELAAERQARDAAEKVRKQTEAELENLTSALFEEANEMVAAARKDTEAAEKRNSQLKSQLGDTEVLLASQQEQLQDLKLTMEKMSERGDNDTARDSVPSTPIHPPAGLFEGLPMSPNLSAAQELPPEHPLFFSQLLSPILRNDVVAFQDFQELLQAARKAAGHVRSSSGGVTANSANPMTSLGQGQHAGSSPNLPGAFSFSSSSPHNSGTFSSPIVPLKDTRFYKRTLLEDIEPTLRLDQAPGLSFLSRRSVMSALLQGSLVVEPFMPGSKFYGPVYSCTLCGEGRKAEPYIRKHRFRTSEEESAQRYPLCDYCLGRIRASGDFMTFMRMVRDGHWRADSEDEQKNAWEESVRLRERMFWARIGGGVVPTVSQRNATPPPTAIKAARNSIDSPALAQKSVDRSPAADDDPAKEQNQAETRRVSLDQKLVEVFKRHRKSMSLGNTMIDFPLHSDRLQRSTTLESIKQESVPTAKADESASSVRSTSDRPENVLASTSTTKIEPEATSAVATEAQGDTNVQAVPKAAGDRSSEAIQLKPSALPSFETPSTQPTAEKVPKQPLPEVAPLHTHHPPAIEAEAANHDSTTVESASLEPVQQRINDPVSLISPSAIDKSSESAAPLTQTSSTAHPDTSKTHTASSLVAAEIPSIASPIDEAVLASPVVDEPATGPVAADAQPSTATADERPSTPLPNEDVPPPVPKKDNRSKTPPSRTNQNRPGGRAVRKKSSNASIKSNTNSNSGTSPRPSLANTKKPSSETKTNRVQDKKQGGGGAGGGGGGGVLARVRAMESQAAAKSAGGKTA